MPANVADGSFEVDLDPLPGDSYLLLLVNQGGSTPSTRAAGFATLRSSQGEDMVLLPVGAARRDLDFSDLRLGPGGAVSDRPLEGSAEDLRRTATTSSRTPRTFM